MADAEDEKQINELFTLIDEDKDGKVNIDEVQKALQHLRLPATREDAIRLIEASDTDKSGEVTIEEFKNYVLQRRKQLREIFDRVDTNKNGVIEFFEIKESLGELHFPNDDKTVSKLMNRIDKNKDGLIQFDEWVELLLMVPNMMELDGIFHYWEDAAISWVDPELPVPSAPEKTLARTILHLSVGGIAGIIAKTITAPLERLKVIYQLNNHPPPMWVVLKNIYQENGWRGFFRSNGVNLLKAAPEMAVKFYSFDRIKLMFADNDADLTPWQRVVAGGLAGTICHLLVFPLDVIKTRMAATSAHGEYGGIWQTFLTIGRNEGWVTPFFRGTVPMILSTLPSNGITFGLYSTLKAVLEERDHVSGTLVASVGTISSTAGTLLTYPFHVIKSRLQVKGKEHEHYDGVRDVVKKTWQRAGWRGFYRGIFPTMIKHVPSQTVAFVTYEALRNFFGLEEKKKKHH